MMVAGWVEVANRNHFPLGVAFGHRFQQHLEAEFGLAVGTDGFALELLGAVVLLAVDCG